MKPHFSKNSMNGNGQADKNDDNQFLPQFANKSAEEMSKSLHVRRTCKSQTPPDDSLEINRQKSRGADSLGTQLKNLQHLIKGYVDNEPSQDCDNHSMSDIDFNPDQKKTSNIFLRNADSNEPSDEADVNKAVIFKSHESSAKSENLSNFGSFCGEFAQQLNNTSFFAGNNDNQLPENMDGLFHKDGGEPAGAR
jgi:hypothetical protein